MTWFYWIWANYSGFDKMMETPAQSSRANAAVVHLIMVGMLIQVQKLWCCFNLRPLISSPHKLIQHGGINTNTLQNKAAYLWHNVKKNLNIIAFTKVTCNIVHVLFLYFTHHVDLILLLYNRDFPIWSQRLVSGKMKAFFNWSVSALLSTNLSPSLCFTSAVTQVS